MLHVDHPTGYFSLVMNCCIGMCNPGWRTGTIVGTIFGTIVAIATIVAIGIPNDPINLSGDHEKDGVRLRLY